MTVQRQYDANGNLGRGQRPGLSLLEVVIALAILLFSVVAISQLISLGGDRAVDVKLQATATMLCQRKLAEATIGFEPLGGGGGYTDFPSEEVDLQGWQYKIEATQDSVSLLWNVQVSVKYERTDGKTTEVQLAQMVLDPSSRGSTQDAPPTQPTTSSTTDTSGTMSGNTGAGSTPAATTPAATTPAATTPSSGSGAKTTVKGS